MLGTTLATNAVLEGKWARTGHDHHRGLSRRARARAPAPAALLQPRHPEADAAGAARLPPRGRRAHRARRRGSRRRSPRTRCATRSSVLQGEEGRSGRDLLHACLRQSGARGARPRARERSSGPRSICAPRRRARRVPRVRALRDRDGEREPDAGHGPLSRALRAGVAALGITRAPRVMQSNGGAVSPGAVRKRAGQHVLLRARGRRHRQRRAGRAARAPEPDHLRHGRHEHRRVPDPRRRAGEEERARRWAASRCARARSTSTRSARAAAASRGSTRAGCSRSARRARARIPGPAAYGRGGTQATVTDANVVLGRLNPKTLLGGRMAMHADKARAAIDELAGELGVDPVEGRGRRDRDHQRQHDGRGARDLGRAGRGPARFHAGRVRRRGAAARGRRRAQHGHAQGARAAAAGAALGDRPAARRRARRLQPDAARARGSGRA